MDALDRIDSKILFQLDRNSRSSYAAIAKSVGIAAETVRYRIDKLENAGVISKFQTVIDVGRAGYAVSKLYLRLVGAGEEQVAEILRFLSSVQEVVWIAHFDGIFDLAFGYRSANMLEVSAFIERFLKRFGQYIVRRSFCTNIVSEYIARDYLIGRREGGGRVAAIYRAAGEPVALDSIDRFILLQLGGDCRITAAEIAQRIANYTEHRALTREAVSKRIRKLERARVITGYRILLDPGAYGAVLMRVLFYLNPQAETELAQFLQGLRAEPRAVYLAKTLGEWDYEWALEVESIAQYRTIIADLTAKFPQAVRDYYGLSLHSMPLFHFSHGL